MVTYTYNQDPPLHNIQEHGKQYQGTGIETGAQNIPDTTEK